MLPLEFVLRRLDNEEKEMAELVVRYHREELRSKPKDVVVATSIGYETIRPIRRYDVEFKAPGFMLPLKSSVPIPLMDHAVRIFILPNYPFPDDSSRLGAPIRFEWVTPIFHPNISPGPRYGGTGVVCWDILKKWVKMFNLKTIVEGLKLLVSNPNPEDPLRLPPICTQAAEYFKKNPMNPDVS